MIIEINEEVIEKDIIKFVWELSCDNKKSSFPRFKSYSDMNEVFLTSIRDEDDKLLACYHNEELVGSINLFVKQDYETLQGSIYAREGFNFVAKEFIDYLRTNYSGYDLYLGYPLENEEAINFLKEINSELIDSSLVMELKKDNFKKNNHYNDVEILKGNRYKEYADFHDKHNPNIYWISERILEKIDLWKIYIIIDNEKIVGSIFIKSQGNKAEVFGISVDEEYRHQGIELRLLSESINNMFLEDVEEVLYFIEEDSNDELEATLKLGFKKIDTYRCYKLVL